MQREPLNISGLEAVPASLKGSVLTIGNFDGVHRGHRRILSHARTLADAAGVAVVAMTFNPPPDLVVRPADARSALARTNSVSRCSTTPEPTRSSRSKRIAHCSPRRLQNLSTKS